MASGIQWKIIKSYKVVQKLLLGGYSVGNNSCSPISMGINYIL